MYISILFISEFHFMLVFLCVIYSNKKLWTVAASNIKPHAEWYGILSEVVRELHSFSLCCYIDMDVYG